MKPRLSLLVATSALYALLFATASHATDITRGPLKMDAIVKPNVIFAMDDSGSMDWEVLLDTDSGILWWDNTNKKAWDSSGVLYRSGDASLAYTYLFPNGSGTGAKKYRVLRDWWGHAAPPIPQLAFLRSSSYNPLYYNPQVTYKAWPEAYVDGATATYADATKTAAKSHPAVSGSVTTDLTATQSLNQTEDFFFTGQAGMTIPAGARLGTVDWYGNLNWGSSLGSASTLTDTRYVAMDYYPATYWVKESCTVPSDGSTCTRAPDGATLKRYEIKSGVTFPTVASLGSARSYADEMQNFANWWQFYRKRRLMLAGSMGKVLANTTGLRMGVVAFNDQADVTMYDSEDTAGASADRRRVMGTFYTNPASGATPTAATLQYVGEQFKRTGSAVVQYACQRNAAFVVTDGFANGTAPTVPSYTASTYGSNVYPYQTTTAQSIADVALSYFTNNLRSDLSGGKVPLGDQTKQNPDPNPNVHMNTYGITLGVKGTVWPMASGRTPWSHPFTWPTPVNDTQTSIDDLWHATINGRGQMFLATTPDETAESIDNALNDIRSRAGAQSAGSLSSVNLGKSDGRLYQATYNPADWAGDVVATRITTSSGAAGAVAWSAATKLAAKDWATRVIVTHNGSSAVAFTASNIGSTVSSGNSAARTAVVNYLRGDRSGEAGSPSTYRKRGSLLGAVINSRPVVDRDTGVVYAATGEGMVHAFDSATGEELWAYVPQGALSAIGASALPTWKFVPLVDGPMNLVKVGSTKLLVGGLGTAGKGYFAIDVTSPRDLTEATLAGKVKWDFPGTSTTYPLGASMGRAIAVNSARLGQVVLLPQGYRPDDRTTLGSNDGKTRLFAINALTGAHVETFVASTSSTTGDPGLAQVSPFIESSGLVRYVYGGDEKGNVWRFDLDTTTAADKAVNIAQLKDASGNAQPVTAAPELVTVKGSRIVLIGAGRLLGLSDFTGSGARSFYAIKDSGSALTNARTGLVTRYLRATTGGYSQLYADGDTNTSNDTPFDWATQRGWYFDLPDGQQVTAKPTVALGALVFTTNKAVSSTCGAESHLYVVNILDGLSMPDAPYATFKLGDTLTFGSLVAGLDTSSTNSTNGSDNGSSGSEDDSDPCIKVKKGASRLISYSTMADNSLQTHKLPICIDLSSRKNAWRQVRRE